MIQNGTVDGGEDALSCSLTAALDVLRNPHRRSVLRYLAEHGRSTPVTELVKFCADDDASGLEMERISIELRHGHLPRLADYGIITYDSQENTIERTSDAIVVHTLLDLVPDR